jgi:hypothetical protein
MKLPWLLFFLISFSSALAQYDANPLAGQRWFTVTAGANSSNKTSWQTSLAFSRRSDVLVTQFLYRYSQQIGGPLSDTCMSMVPGRIHEWGTLWGDGWAGKRWYMSITAGMAFQIIGYCKNLPYKPNSYVNSYTVGIPANAEFGYDIGKYSSIALVITGNWNFRRPYAGASLGYVWKIKKKKVVAGEE